jgi:hypothetical protein
VRAVLLVGSLLALAACPAPVTPPVADLSGGAPTMHWTRGPGTPAQTARAGLPLVHVVAERRLVGYGGTPIGPGAAWAFSLKDDAWKTLVLGVAPPSGRTGHCAAHLPMQNLIVFVGGHDDATDELPALGFTVGTPNFIELDKAYAPREGCAAAYLDGSGQAVVFGGQLAGGLSAQTWLFDGATQKLTRADPAQAPPARRGAALVADAGNPSGPRLVLFGGTDGTSAMADVWLYDGGTWGELGTSADPRAGTTDAPRPLGRSGAAVALDPTRRLLYVHGGEREGQVLDDLWRLDLRSATWERLDLSPRPEARKDASVAYDAILDRLLLFGGEGSGTRLADGWMLSSS